MICGLLGCGIYGSYIWLKTGIWGAITVHDIIIRKIDFSFLLNEVDWVGIQKLSEIYLHSNIGWTFFLVPAAIVSISGFLAICIDAFKGK